MPLHPLPPNLELVSRVRIDPFKDFKKFGTYGVGFYWDVNKLGNYLKSDYWKGKISCECR